MRVARNANAFLSLDCNSIAPWLRPWSEQVPGEFGCRSRIGLWPELELFAIRYRWCYSDTFPALTLLVRIQLVRIFGLFQQS